MKFFSRAPILVMILLIVQGRSQKEESSYDTFLKCFISGTGEAKAAESVYTPTNTTYGTVLRSYTRNARFKTSSAKKPVFIIAPTSHWNAMPATSCSMKQGLRLRIRSGGHDYAGASYAGAAAGETFAILDTFKFRSVEVNTTDSTASVEAGATLGELYYAIWKASPLLAFPAGIHPTVAVGGHISGGGYGNLLRRFGLASDNLLEARIVDSGGNSYDMASAGEDVFWAIKGGGGASFGVIVSYKLRLVAVPEKVAVFRIERYENQSMTEAVMEWQRVAPAIDERLFIRLILEPVKKTVRATFVAMFLGSAERLHRLAQKKLPVLGLTRRDCLEMSHIQSVLWWANFKTGTAPEALLNRNLGHASFMIRKSDYVQTPIPKAGLDAIWKKMTELGNVGLVLNPYGGKMDRISPTATPFPHRKGNLYKIQYSVNWDKPSAELERNYSAQIRSLFSFMTPFVSKNPRSAFLNYRDLDIGVNSFGPNSYEEGKVYGVKYFGNNFDRLVRAKMLFDRDNYFRNEQSIPILPTKA